MRLNQSALQAVFDLQNSNEKIVDIALKDGYESPTTFTRAFRGLHGVTPSSVRKMSVSLKTYPPITFLLTVKGVKQRHGLPGGAGGVPTLYRCHEHRPEGFPGGVLPEAWGDLETVKRFWRFHGSGRKGSAGCSRSSPRTGHSRPGGSSVSILA